MKKETFLLSRDEIAQALANYISSYRVNNIPHSGTLKLTFNYSEVNKKGQMEVQITYK